MEEKTPAGKIPPLNEFPLAPWAFKDPEMFFTDDRPSNNKQYKRSFMYYQDYAGKYGPTRSDSIEYYSRKHMIHHRLEKYNPVVRVG
ncbi:MAG: hypothetical protein ACKPKO_42810, partial [Candidatus Fonsibacter sp.]